MRSVSVQDRLPVDSSSAMGQLLDQPVGPADVADSKAGGGVERDGGADAPDPGLEAVG